MSYRDDLPQLGDHLFLTDGGIETVLIFHEGLELPEFAAFDLLKDADGTEWLRRYYAPYIALARERGLGFVLESPTWRASPRWAAEIGHDREQLDDLNRKAIELLEEIRDEQDAPDPPVVISGCVGPHDDGYRPAKLLTAEAAQQYHATQIGTFAGTAADMITAVTMTYADEGIGVARAAAKAGLPAATSFTVETDGRLPSGQALGEAIEQVDRETGGSPSYYMINCAHPTHFASVLEQGDGWRDRIQGVRANASTRSHAELDEAEELDDGDPVDLGARYAGLRGRLPRLNVLGGCCGTDHRHVAAIRDAWLGSARGLTIVLIVLAAVLTSLTATPAAKAHRLGVQSVERPTAGVRLGTCDMAVGVVRDSAERLRQFVPPGYTLGQSLYMLGDPETGMIVSWTMRCDRVRIPDRAPVSAKLAFVGVQIEDPDRPTSGSTLANDFDIYTLFAHTNSRPVARWLRAGGMPAEFVRGVRIERSSSAVDIAVPADRSPYGLELFPADPDPLGVHRHENAFWHDEGGHPVRLSLVIPQAEDIACIGVVAACGTIEAPRRSPVVDLLGAPSRPVDFVFDHVGLQGSTVAIRPAGR